jgi:hypothetical protein
MTPEEIVREMRDAINRIPVSYQKPLHGLLDLIERREAEIAEVRRDMDRHYTERKQAHPGWRDDFVLDWIARLAPGGKP